MSPPSTSLAYRPELSGLRAVAVGVVVLHHWLQPPFPLGEMGRCLFFVLSGYLVSGIAWKYDAYVGAPGPWLRRLGTFYARRVLRIIPPYYLALAGCALLPLATVREHPWWFLLPGANLLIYKSQGWGDGVGHYWTLAVDEQFYLLWPLVLGVVGRRRWALLVLAASGPAFRVGWAAWHGPGMVHLLLPASLDLFALGAMLRLCQGQMWLRRLARGRYVAGSWVLCAGLRTWLDTGGPWAEAWALGYVSLGALAAFTTVNWLLNRPHFVAQRVLNHPVAQWVGQRSYGVYLYHLPLLVFWQRLVYHFVPAAAERTLLMGPLPVLLALLPALAVLSAASWHFVEAPLDRFKNRFQYTAPSLVLKPVQ
ncbi:acyltransferase [Hymenobacter sp. BT683]|uniref:Acyltransferase n=1 Tax=Hymenobacter jeongseonensis TaxID=2791027 RepID=A0ABS0ICZ7_9BACT|nr:acyltransferase [Hymenobacter jeongseonensis]MBF9236223.1 acyltransferase [Hymenobacter jeongseonensis]